MRVIEAYMYTLYTKMNYYEGDEFINFKNASGTKIS